MIFLTVLSLVIAFCVFEIQAALSAEHHEISILDLIGKNPKILKSGIVNTTYKYLLPEPNRNDSFKVGNNTFYKYPAGGIKVDPGFWEERNITFPNTTK
jgi:hypothetical protein